MTDPTTFRDSIGRLGPPWTQDEWGSKFKYMFGIILDAITDALRDGVKTGFPGVGTPEALPYQGNDRKIIRGFNEPDAAYAARLSRAFEDWKHAGQATAVAQQLLALVSPIIPKLRIVWSTKISGILTTTWVTFDAGSVTFQQVTPGNWDWDGLHSPQWSRFWLIVYPGIFTHGRKIGDGWKIGDGTLLGVGGVTHNQIRTARRIIQTWKRAASQCGATTSGGGIIAAFSIGLFDPSSAPGAPMPDGTWGYPPNRDPGAAYLDGF